VSGRDGRYEDGRWAVERVASELLGLGFVISSPELVGLRDVEDPAFKNAADILVWRRSYSEPGYRSIEVKGLGARFEGPFDWPFPDVILDRADTWHRKTSRPFAYVNVSRPTGAMVAVIVSTAIGHDWVEEKDDRRSATRRPYRVVNPDRLTTMDILRRALETT
jgi:hypothetical protein